VYNADTYVGLIEVILSPELDFTNSLLMNRPVGRVIFLPFGAVKSTVRPDILVDMKRREGKDGLAQQMNDALFEVENRGLVKYLNM
jgi:hypothetical protein